MQDIPPETPFTDEQKDLCGEAAELIYRAMRVKISAARAYSASVMWDALTRRQATPFVPRVMRPAQLYLVAQLRALSARRLAEVAGPLSSKDERFRIVAAEETRAVDRGEEPDDLIPIV